MQLLEYFHSINVQKQLNKLTQKYKNKKIVIYGAGEYFQILYENFDLSHLNIVGISDKKFETSKEANFTVYKPLTPSELKEFDYDAIIMALFDDTKVRNYLEFELLFNTQNEDKLIIPIIKPSLIDYIKIFNNGYLTKNILVKTFKNKLLSKKQKYKQFYIEKIKQYNFLIDIIEPNNLKDATNKDLTNLKKEKIKKAFWNNYKTLYFEINKKLRNLTSIIDVKTLKPCKDKLLRDFQLEVTDFMKQMSDFFEENQLKYFLIGGSLIGALRHEGFVPWDDDIDIGMMRNDYEKLKMLLKDNFIPVDVSQIYTSKSNYTKKIDETLKKNPNKLIYFIGPKYTQIFKGTSIKDCVYIDIFPHEYYKDSYTVKEFNDYITYIKSIFDKNDNFQDIVNCLKSERENNSNITTNSNTIYYSIDCFVSYTILHTKFISKNTIFPLRKAKFESYEFYIPNNAEEYIKIEYPNYNSMPSCIEIAPDLEERLKF